MTDLPRRAMLPDRMGHAGGSGAFQSAVRR